MTFDEIIKVRAGNIIDAKIKIVRHQDNRVDINEIYETDKEKFESYQGSQGRDVFNCDYIASFLGVESHAAKFVGLYKVNRKISESQFSKKYPTYSFWKNQPKSYDVKVFYELRKLDGFDDLIGRIIIDWGNNPRAWVQNNIEKEILEILPEGYVKEFRGYLELLLSFSELKNLIEHKDSNRILYNRLTSVNGIYLITDKETGGQYVGSAYGKDGIWGRWKNYADDGHGGNQLLRKLLTEKGQDYKYNFNFSILQTLQSGLTDSEIIEYENLYKNKLGRKALILNRN